jgi:hypothetical protein
VLLSGVRAGPGGQWSGSAASGQPAIPARNSNYSWAGEPMIAAGPEMDAHGLSAVSDEGCSGGPGKRQRSSGSTPVGQQVKRPKQTGQPGYARVAGEGTRVAIVCEGYPGAQVSKDNFVAIQKAVGRLVDEVPEDGFTPGLTFPTGPKGQRSWSARIRRPVTGWPGWCLI